MHSPWYEVPPRIATDRAWRREPVIYLMGRPRIVVLDPCTVLRWVPAMIERRDAFDRGIVVVLESFRYQSRRGP